MFSKDFFPVCFINAHSEQKGGREGEREREKGRATKWEGKGNGSSLQLDFRAVLVEFVGAASGSDLLS